MFTGGGTGGHLFPLVAVSRALTLLSEEYGTRAYDFFFVGPHTFGEEIFASEQIQTSYIVTGKLRRYFSFRILLDIIKIPVGALQSFWHVYVIMPDLIFSKGGYGSFFSVLAGWLYRIPIVIHESDTSMGLGNSLLTICANRIIFSFPKENLARKEIVLGNPIREELFQTDPDTARKILGLSLDRHVILIQGGSQGSETINNLVAEALPDLLLRYEIIHQTGKGHTTEIQDPSYHPYEFSGEEELAAAYAVSTIVVSRAGSGNIFEIAAAEKPSILIPLPSARGDHQRINAYAYADRGAAIIMEQPNLSPHLFGQQISELVENEEERIVMTRKAQDFARPRAAYDIANVISDILEF